MCTHTHTNYKIIWHLNRVHIYRYICLHTHGHAHIDTETHLVRAELQPRGAKEEAAGPWPNNHLLESDHQALQHHCTNTPTLDPLAWREGRRGEDKEYLQEEGWGEKEEEKEGGKEIKKWNGAQEKEDGVCVYRGKWKDGRKLRR